MAASGMFAMAVLLAVAGVSAAMSMSTTPAPDPMWSCPEVTVQANASLKQIVGDWLVLQLERARPTPQRELCSMLSVVDLREEDGNRTSFVFNAYWPRKDGSKRFLLQEAAVSLANNNQEFVSDTGAAWRLHSVSANGRVVVLAACGGPHPAVLWFTLGVSQEDDVDVAPDPRRATHSVRRDAKLCLELADAATTTTTSSSSSTN